MIDNETKERLVDEYIEKLIEDLPDFMSDEHLVYAVSSIVSNFAADYDHVKRIMVLCMMAMTEPGNCSCPSCVEKRKDTMH